ncbi:MAG: phospho-sugar mutase [bacterium]
MIIAEKLSLVKKGFVGLNVAQIYKDTALKYLEQWLTEEQFADYQSQLDYFIETAKWDLLLDSFYQIIPFGTGGRRGEVGLGPNKINPWTIQSSAQGHAQYLIKKFGDIAKTRGVVISYDVRVYKETADYDLARPNPVKDLNCLSLASSAAEVYAANGFTVYFFKNYTSTPEMSFMVTHLNAVAGDMISASHNPPEYNGIKVVNDFGGQLIPPDDQELVDIVRKEVTEIKKLDFESAKKQNILKYVTPEQHQAYFDAAKKTAQGDYREAKIFFSPYNGTSIYSVLPVMKQLGFDITMDIATGIPDGSFPAIMYHIPNPEVRESYLGLIPEADKINADMIIVTDPDGDRIGLMSKEQSKWRFITGNEIMILATAFLLEELKNKGKLQPTNVIVKTLVTTNFLKLLADKYQVQINGEQLVGIKYIADVMNQLAKEGRIADFILGGEESHGMTAGDYIREKDSVIPAILLSELASKLKRQQKTLGNFLDELYTELGYFNNFQNEIRLPGAEGMSKIAQIQSELRKLKPQIFGNYQITRVVDKLEGDSIKSESDEQSRNVLYYELKSGDPEINFISITIRPSGTEPKTKIYFEIGTKAGMSLEEAKQFAEKKGLAIEKVVITYLYKLIGIDFPERGFLLFRMLPSNAKLKYFEIEAEIIALTKIPEKGFQKSELDKLLSFLGSNATDKVNPAFQVKFGKTIEEYLELE